MTKSVPHQNYQKKGLIIKLIGINLRLGHIKIFKKNQNLNKKPYNILLLKPQTIEKNVIYKSQIDTYDLKMKLYILYYCYKFVIDLS